MAYSVRDVVETFLRLVQAEILPRAVLVPADEAFEVPAVPSLVVQGPKLVEDTGRRTMAREFVRDTDAIVFEDRPYPRFYHLDFDLVATTAKAADLVDLVAQIVAFFAFHRELAVPPEPEWLNLTEQVPMGGLARVNLTNLRQASGRYRIEDCLVYAGEVVSGKLIVDRTFDYTAPTFAESRTDGPDD